MVLTASVTVCFVVSIAVFTEFVIVLAVLLTIYDVWEVRVLN